MSLLQSSATTISATLTEIPYLDIQIPDSDSHENECVVECDAM